MRTCDSSVIHIAAICGTELPTLDANKIAARSREEKCLASFARRFKRRRLVMRQRPDEYLRGTHHHLLARDAPHFATHDAFPVKRSRRATSVWTRDRARGEQIARRLEVGAVNVNDMFVNVFSLPIPQGGWKQSGIGARLGGTHGIRKYCRPQAITATRLAPRSELLWYPYTALKGKLFLRVTRFLFAHDWRRRLARRPR